MLRVNFSVVLLLAALCASDASGQTPSAPDSGQVFRATTSEVVLDIVVRDKRGRQVKNLKAEEIEIIENGVRQQVVGFRLVGTRRAQPGKQAAVAQSAASTAARSLRAVNPLCIIFHNLGPEDRRPAIEAVQEFLKSELMPDTYIGLFVLDDHLRPVFPFNNDRAEVAKAVQDVFTRDSVDLAVASEAILSANPTEVSVNTVVDNVAHTATSAMVRRGGEIATTAIAGAQVSTGEAAAAMRGDQARERSNFGRISGMRETDKLSTLVKELSALPGRKTLLLVSGGLLTAGDPERFDAILEDANRAGMTVYALDPHGLKDDYNTASGTNLGVGQAASVSRGQNTANATLSEMRSKSRQGDDLELAVRASDAQAPLRQLAEGTGGFLIANTNEYRKPFQKIADELEAHYEATYRPTVSKYDGRFRKIEVKVARPEFQVENRAGYFAMPALKDVAPLRHFESTGLAILSVQPPPHTFDFGAAGYHFRDRAALAFEVPVAPLVATPNPQQKTQRLHISVFALIKDATGQVVDKFGVDSPHEIPEAEFANAKAGSLTFSHALNLPAGAYSIETAVIDREAGKTSVEVNKLNVPAPPQGLGISSVVLVQRADAITGTPDVSDPLVVEGRRVIPLLAPAIKRDAQPFVYFVVYPEKGAPANAQIHVELLLGGTVVGQQKADLPAPNAAGVIPMVIRAPVRPGDCELRISALQGDKSATESVKYTVLAK